MSLLAIKYQRGHLEILNQLALPHKSVYEEIRGVEDGWQAIKTMKVGESQSQPIDSLVLPLTCLMELIIKLTKFVRIALASSVIFK